MEGTIVGGAIKYPLFYDFDVKVTKNKINTMIYHLEAMNFNVLVVVCDQAGENVKLQVEKSIIAIFKKRIFKKKNLVKFANGWPLAI